MTGLRCAVCGMMINSRNLNINEHSFIKANTELNIDSCPFCGVGSLYLAEGNETYQVVLQTLNAESIRVLENAMKLEVFNGEFYQEASKLAQSEAVARMFKDLSSIEFMHARIHMRLGGFNSLPRLHKPDYSKHNTDEQLLVEAAKRERHAVHFYERNSSKVNSDVVRKAFGALMEVEKQHIDIVGHGDDSFVPQSRVTSR